MQHHGHVLVEVMTIFHKGAVFQFWVQDVMLFPKLIELPPACHQVPNFFLQLAHPGKPVMGQENCYGFLPHKQCTIHIGLDHYWNVHQVGLRDPQVAFTILVDQLLCNVLRVVAIAAQTCKLLQIMTLGTTSGGSHCQCLDGRARSTSCKLL